MYRQINKPLVHNLAELQVGADCLGERNGFGQDNFTIVLSFDHHQNLLNIEHGITPLT